MQNSNSVETKQWWKFGHVWMVIGGPAIVVVASFITLYLAISSPNEIVSDHDLDGGSAQISKTINGSVAPALQARNHAATGVVPVSKQ